MISRAQPIEDLPDVDPAETMQLLINRIERLWRYAAAQVDALRPGVARNQSMDNMDYELWATWDDNMNIVITNSYWIQREKELSELLGKLTEAAQRIGLSERRTRVQEAQTQLMGEALAAAAEAAGLNAVQKRRLGSELRKQLVADVESTAVEIAA
jgi:Arc/MetJ family transcription regulator